MNLPSHDSSTVRKFMILRTEVSWNTNTCQSEPILVDMATVYFPLKLTNFSLASSLI